MTVYLLHFDQCYKHAGHYLGETDKPVDERRDEHQSGHGAKLTAAAAATGITFVVARTWPGRYAEERRLKGRPKGSRELKELCPCCHPMPRIDRWAGGKPAWARQAEAEPAREHHSATPTPVLAPPQSQRPKADPYERGAQMGAHFLGQQNGKNAEQLTAVYEYVTGPWHEAAHHTAEQAETFRGYADTIEAHLTQLRERERQAETDAELEAEAG